MGGAVAELLWQQREDTGPASRANLTMAYEASASRTILFGGVHWGDYLKAFNDTWEWGGDGWVQLADTGPSPRQFARLAFDADRQVIVLFGGATASFSWVFDTWEWDGSAWTQIEDVGPSIQTWFADMVYDGARKRTLLNDGSVQSGGKGTWTWDGSAWTQVDDGGPSRRQLPALAYDPERNRAVQFGGGMWGTPNGDTWEWDGAIWKQAQDIGPARLGHAMVWDGSSVLLFGGAKDVSQHFGDTWAWDGAHWRQRQDFGPDPRMDYAIAWDAARDRTVLFGGAYISNEGSRIFGDTWEAFEKV